MWEPPTLLPLSYLLCSIGGSFCRMPVLRDKLADDDNDDGLVGWFDLDGDFGRSTKSVSFLGDPLDNSERNLLSLELVDTSRCKFFRFCISWLIDSTFF